MHCDGGVSMCGCAQQCCAQEKKKKLHCDRQVFFTSVTRCCSFFFFFFCSRFYQRSFCEPESWSISDFFFFFRMLVYFWLLLFYKGKLIRCIRNDCGSLKRCHALERFGVHDIIRLIYLAFNVVKSKCLQQWLPVLSRRHPQNSSIQGLGKCLSSAEKYCQET